MEVGLWPLEEADETALVSAEQFEVLADGVEPLTRFQRNPIGFLTEVLGISEATLRWSINDGYERHRWDGTRDPLVIVAEALRDWRDVGVESATGTGKSFLAAGLILWFLGSWRSRAFTFAPKEDQLRLFIWAEIAKMWGSFQAKFPTAELTDLRIRMVPGSDDWGAWGYSVGVRANEQSATKAQGMHAEHMLLVYEETPGIPMPVLEAGENTCTADHNLRLALGNPDHQYDALHRFCSAPDVIAVRISALDHPNIVTGRDIVPGATSRRSLERRRAKYGEESPNFKSRARGISPEEAADALYRKAWLDKAVERWRLHMDTHRNAPHLHRAKGVDVARSENGDLGAIATFLGPIAETVVAFPCPDVVQLGKRVYAEMRTEYVSPANVGIDSVGVGGGTVDTVNDLLTRTERVDGLNGAAKAYGYIREVDGKPYVDERGTAVQFGNLRAQMHWQLRHDLQYGDIGVPDDPELHEELLAIKAEDRGGKVYVQDKDEIRAVLGRSPNKADVVIYGNWVRNRDKKPRVVPVHAPWVEGVDATRWQTFVSITDDTTETVGGLGRGW